MSQLIQSGFPIHGSQQVNDSMCDDHGLLLDPVDGQELAGLYDRRARVKAHTVIEILHTLTVRPATEWLHT